MLGLNDGIEYNNQYLLARLCRISNGGYQYITIKNVYDENLKALLKFINGDVFLKGDDSLYFKYKQICNTNEIKILIETSLAFRLPILDIGFLNAHTEINIEIGDVCFT